MTGKFEVTTSLYSTHLGLFTLSWSEILLGRSLQLDLNRPNDFFDCNSPLQSVSLRLSFKRLQFWDKRGSKSLTSKSTPGPKIKIYWDLHRAKFGSGPEPISGFYIAAVANGNMVLLVGDLAKEAYTRTGASNPEKTRLGQFFVSRKDRIFGDRVYSTIVRLRGKNREITIDCSLKSDSRLCVSVDGSSVLTIKRLKWKFRGNEMIEVEGVNVQFSWDVYNWLCKDDSEREAVFMFRFENLAMEEEQDQEQEQELDVSYIRNMMSWSHQSFSGCGISEVESKKKGLFRKRRSSSASSSTSSFYSSGGSSSVMDWASTEDDELGGPLGFSLVVYARRQQ